MSKNLLIIIISLILLVIFINGFSAAYTARKIGNIAYVLALGIDVGENSKMKISAQFTKSSAVSPASGTSSEDKDNIILVSGEADSIFGAINLLNSYIGKEVNLSHCNLFIFSEKFAKQGISSEIYSLLNNEEVRPTANLIISKSTAYDYLNNSNPNLEKLTTQYYETFAITGRFTGYFSNITIGDFYNSLSSPYSDPTAILGGLNLTARQENSEQDSENQENVITNPDSLTAGTSSIMGNRGTENFGIAVFKDDKLCGELTATESICHLLISNKIDSCTLSIDNPVFKKEAKKMEVEIFPVKNTKINITLQDGIPHISLDIKVNADIMTLDKDVNYETNEILAKISNAITKYLKDEFNNYLNKVTKNFNVDIDYFSAKAPAHFLTISEWTDFNWAEKFKNTEFDVNIDVNVLSTILITKT